MEFDLDYAKKVILGEAEGIKSVVNVVDESFAKAVEMIYNCKGSIIISGIGKAGIIGRKISATLASTGTPSHFLHPAEAIHGDLGRIRKEDILVVLSYGGETDEIIRLINIVKQLSIRMISITGDCDSTLSKYSDIVLCMGKINEACPLGIAPSVSTACMLAIGDAIAFTVMKARNFSVEDYVRFHPGGSLGAKLMTVGQSMLFKPGEEMPIAKTSDTIKQMLVKTSHIKRHGATMIVAEDGKLAGVITDADMRRLMAKHGNKCLDFKTGDVMTAECKKIREDALAAEATAIFHKFRIDDLPVIDDEGKPTGMIDVQDIVMIKVVG